MTEGCGSGSAELGEEGRIITGVPEHRHEGRRDLQATRDMAEIEATTARTRRERSGDLRQS